MICINTASGSGYGLDENGSDCVTIVQGMSLWCMGWIYGHRFQSLNFKQISNPKQLIRTTVDHDISAYMQQPVLSRTE